MGRVTGALEGDLERFPAADVLQFLGFSGASGRVEFERPGERAELVLEGGRPVRGHTSRGSVRLGEALVHRHALTGPALAAALAAQRDRPDEPLGALLVGSGAATVEDVTRGLTEVLQRIVLGILLWPAGRFRFEPGPPEPGAGVPFSTALDPLLFEGLQQADEAAGG
jgi:hypothetical protein